MRGIPVIGAWVAACLMAWAGAGAQVRGTAMKPGATGATLAERFANPPAATRILKIIHGWPDSPAQQDSIIRTLEGQGFGGVVCNVSFDRYLESDDHWKAFVRAVGEAKRAGMALWLYDERGYPSGTAGGITLRGHPEWEAHGLLASDSEVGPGKMELAIPPGELRLAAAFPVGKDGMDLAHRVNLAPNIESAKIEWTAPAGKWHVVAITEGRLFEGTHATMSLGDHIPYVNLLMAEPTHRFLEVTHGQYAERLGPDLGKWFISTFTDEPSLMSMFLRPMPYRPLAWSPGFAAEFRKRRGYDVEPILPALVADAGAKGRRWRYDYWKTVGELVSQNFFGEIQKWCHDHNVRSGGHLLSEEQLLSHVPLYGDFFQCARRLDAPSIDCLTSMPAEVPWYIARLISSAAELEGRPVTMCETSDFSQSYRPEGDTRPVHQVSEAEIRGTVNRLMLNGITTITSYYTFNGISDEQLNRLNLHVGRCSTMLGGGHQVADVAVVYPIESVWPRYRPAHNWANESPDAATIDAAYRAAANGLWGANRDFAYIDSRALAQAKVAQRALVHGNLRWRVVVLPGVDTLTLAAWENLLSFVRAGGAVVAMGALPANSESEFPSPHVLAMAKEIFGNPSGASIHTNAAGGAGVFLPQGAATLLPDVVDSLLARDVSVGGKVGAIHATHRRVDGQEVYFLINDSGDPWNGSVSVSAAGEGNLWNPVTGKAVELASPSGIPLSLEPYGGVLLRFARAVTPRRKTPRGGLLGNLTVTELPLAQPTVGHGEFVQGGLVEGRRQPGRQTWTTRGTITKTNVDTHLMATFRYPDGVSLAGVDCLVVGSSVPAGQKTPAQLLVMLHQKDGSMFLTETGRPLSAPGWQVSYVPLSGFRPFSTTGSGGTLDPAQVDAIIVGWGGYFGTQGETVEFSFHAPRAAHRRK